MLTRGPKDSPDPCKAQGQPCTLRGTKGRVTGAQAQPWAWLCCESRPCRGGGGGVGAALAAESPGSPRRDLPDPTTHKRGDEGLGQKVPTAERCVPALRASPVGWHLSAPLGRGDAPPPCDIDAEARASAARGRAEVAASSRTGLRSREPGGLARSLGRAEVQEGPRGVGEPDSGAGARGADGCPAPAPASSSPGPACGPGPGASISCVSPTQPRFAVAPSVLAADTLVATLGLTAGEGRPGLPAGPGPGAVGDGADAGSLPGGNGRQMLERGPAGPPRLGAGRSGRAAHIFQAEPGSPCGRKEASLGGAGEPSRPHGKSGPLAHPQRHL